MSIRKPKTHALVKAIKAELLARRGEGEWMGVAERAGITYRSLCAFAQGTMTEMVASRMLHLANELGFKVTFSGPRERS